MVSLRWLYPTCMYAFTSINCAPLSWMIRAYSFAFESLIHDHRDSYGIPTPHQFHAQDPRGSLGSGPNNPDEVVQFEGKSPGQGQSGRRTSDKGGMLLVPQALFRLIRGTLYLPSD
jgi:hypothetical protein